MSTEPRIGMGNPGCGDESGRFASIPKNLQNGAENSCILMKSANNYPIILLLTEVPSEYVNEPARFDVWFSVDLIFQ